MPDQQILLYTLLCFIVSVLPALYYALFSIADLTLAVCCLILLYGCACWDINYCTNGMHVTTHAHNFLVHVFCMVGPG